MAFNLLPSPLPSRALASAEPSARVITSVFFCVATFTAISDATRMGCWSAVARIFSISVRSACDFCSILYISCCCSAMIRLVCVTISSSGSLIWQIRTETHSTWYFSRSTRARLSALACSSERLWRKFIAEAVEAWLRNDESIIGWMTCWIRLSIEPTLATM